MTALGHASLYITMAGPLLLARGLALEKPKPRAVTGRGNARGYMTTPQELASIREKAARNILPYRAAVEKIVTFAGDPSYWPYGTICGEQNCPATLQPAYIGRGSPLIYAKAMAYHLTGNSEYASAVRARILGLVDTYGYGGEKYSGRNQCILNLSWYLPGFIMAGDLIEDYPGWSGTDKQAFQRWLADEVFKKVDWASEVRSNNWGSAASATAGMVADYLVDYGHALTDRNGNHLTAQQAYEKAKQRQIDRMNGNSYMDNHNCHQPVGIRPDGGIPEELARGTTGCDGGWIKDLDASWTYTQTFLQGLVMHAELLLRRGDNSLYENPASDGRGSLLRAVHFVINNPLGPSKTVPWKEPNEKPTLEVTYRYYRDSSSARELRLGRPDRFIGGKSDQMLHFGTLTHGFASGEDVGPPPMVMAPGGKNN